MRGYIWLYCCKCKSKFEGLFESESCVICGSVDTYEVEEDFEIEE